MLAALAAVEDAQTDKIRHRDAIIRRFGFNDIRSTTVVSTGLALSSLVWLWRTAHGHPEEGKTFAHYVDFLEKKGYTAPNMKKSVDMIRTHGNKATHVLETADAHRAEGTVSFTAFLG